MTPSILKQLFEVNNRILHQRHEQIFYFLLLLLLFLLLYFFFLKHTLPQNERLASLLLEGVLNLQKQKTVPLFI